MLKRLVVLLGPTGVGKTDLSISVARELGASIVSSDSRQLYKGMSIGTAVPTPEQLAAVKHYFIQTIELTESYTAGRYEREALEQVNELFKTADYVVVSGGSGMYIDALCYGIDDIAPSEESLRAELNLRVETEGLDSLVDQLKELDPEYVSSIETTQNKNRIIRALEVCILTGKKYSSLRTGTKKERDFEITKIGLTRPRTELYERINLRVDMMLEDGLEDEVRGLYPMKHLNSLQSVGYREFFDYFDSKTTREEAIDLIKRNSRRYAKRQMTWFKRDSQTKWFSPEDFQGIIDYIKTR